MSVPVLEDYATHRELRAHFQPEASPLPLVSIVTITLNGAATLARTIESVQAQKGVAIEHIVVDGGSTDNTLELLRNALRPDDYWISEPDYGISDAFNKGVAMARGTYIQILNADDWLSEGQIPAAVSALKGSCADFVFGDLIFYDGGRPVFHYLGDANYRRSIHRRMPSVSHATMLARRSAFERIGLFDTTYARAMDYDWLLRLHRAGGHGAYCSRILGHMTHDGVSNREFLATIDEVMRIAIAHGRHPLLAAAEAGARKLKTSAAQPIRRHLRPLYHLIRRTLNPAFKPASLSR